MGRGVTVYDLDGDKVPAHKTETRLLDSRTAFPIGLLALQREACWVDYAERQLRSLGCTVLGTLVDGVFFEERYRELVLERLVRGEHHNGVTFDLKDEPACKVPTCQQRRPNNTREAPMLPSQIVVLETDTTRIERPSRTKSHQRTICCAWLALCAGGAPVPSRAWQGSAKPSFCR